MDVIIPSLLAMYLVFMMHLGDVPHPKYAFGLYHTLEEARRAVDAAVAARPEIVKDFYNIYEIAPGDPCGQPLKVPTTDAAGAK